MRHVKLNRVVVRGRMVHACVAMVLGGKDVACARCAERIVASGASAGRLSPKALVRQRPIRGSAATAPPDPYRDREGAACGTVKSRRAGTAMSVFAGLTFALAFGLFGVSAAPGQTSEGSTAAAGEPVNCYTTYIGPPGGHWRDASNWSPVMPRRGDAVCVSGDVVDSLDLPEGVTVRVFDPYRDRDDSVASGPRTGRLHSDDSKQGRPIRGSAATLTGVGLNPIVPPVDAMGACCTGSQCQFTDYFDCREMGGHFRQGVICSGATCSTGVCCRENPECTDSTDVGQSMTKSLCDIEGGVYIGGAAGCDETDPCQAHRIPLGYEIHEFIGGTEKYRLPPRINNCGVVVFTRDLHWQLTSEIFLYDNGAITQLTDNDGPDAFPDINDSGVIVHNRNTNPDEQVILLDIGMETVLSEGNVGSPNINNIKHVAWSKFVPGACNLSASESDIWFYDGASARKFYSDGRSNQGASINDQDEIAWTNFTFPCGGGDPFGWTSEILFAVDSGITSLPTGSLQSGGPRPDNTGRVLWEAAELGLELWENGETTVIPVFRSASPRLNDHGDAVYQRTVDSLGWQVHLIREGVTYDISTDLEHFTFANGNVDINEAGEIVWNRRPGPSDITGIRLMRRIRNGDTDFDGDIDLDDFIPMPACFTGPVITDGLCECRFFDIDHDRDVDMDDYDYLMRNYTGPLEDCNGNSTLDLEELLTGAAADCDLNGRIDSCDLSDDPLIDCDLNGRIDVCDIADNPAIDCNVNARVDSCDLSDDPLIDCDVNGRIDVCDIADSPAIDCNVNGRIDSCDLIDDPSLDADLNGFIDSCCSPPAPPAPTPELIANQVSVKNRFLSFDVDTAGVGHAIHVTFVDLPAPFDLLNGQSMWVGEPREVSQNGANVDQIEGFPNFWAATLTCVPRYTDWGVLGTINVYHENVVPLGVYAIQVVKQACGAGSEINYSPALTITNAKWGDTMEFCGGDGPCTPPEGSVNVSDVIAILGAFSSAPGAIVKPRADLEPATLDLTINVSDALAALTGFAGLPYPFPITNPSPCGE